MTTPTAPVDSIVQLSFRAAMDEADQMMGGAADHITMNDLTAVEMVALLAIIRPAYERRAAAQRQPAPVLELVRSGKRRRA